MEKLVKWFLLLNKRLYKKPTFLVLMALIPLCVMALSFAAQRSSGFLHVALGQEDPNDPISNAIVEAFLAEKSLIRFTEAESDGAAVEMVRTGKADVAWVFPKDMQGRINAFLANKSRRNAVVQVVERETTVFTRIVQEKLVSELYVHCARGQYLLHIRKSIDQLASVSDADLMALYEGMALSEELFVFEDVEGNVRPESEGNYVTAPIRGLLAVLVCLCAGAATIFYMRDEQVGTFALVRESQRLPVALGCVMIAALNIAVVAIIALAAVGMLNNPLLEVAMMLVYCLCCAGFWLLLKAVLGSMKWICALMPILLVAMVALCPVFLQLGPLAAVGHLLPPTYYIKGAYDAAYLLYGAAYGAGLMGLAALVEKLKSLRL